MKVEGVNFVDEEVKKMKKREFINKHKTSFFLIGQKQKEKISSLTYTTGSLVPDLLQWILFKVVCFQEGGGVCLPFSLIC